MTAYRTLYLTADGDRASPMVSPLLAKSHEGLPPALIHVAEHDPLHDDGTRYAGALRANGSRSGSLSGRGCRTASSTSPACAAARRQRSRN